MLRSRAGYTAARDDLENNNDDGGGNYDVNADCYGEDEKKEKDEEDADNDNYNDLGSGVFGVQPSKMPRLLSRAEY